MTAEKHVTIITVTLIMTLFSLLLKEQTWKHEAAASVKGETIVCETINFYFPGPTKHKRYFCQISSTVILLRNLTSFSGHVK